MNLEQYIQVLTYTILAGIVVLINFVSLFIIFWSKRLMSKPSTVLLINLIGTHLFQGMVVMPIYALRKSRQYPAERYPIVCDCWRFSYMLTFYGTCINVLLIALDRFIATKYFIKYSSQHYKHYHFISMVATGWTYVILLCVIPFIPINRGETPSHPFYCNYIQPAEWTSFMLLFNTVLPYLSVILIYVYISRQIGSSTKVTYKNNNGDNKNNNNGLNVEDNVRNKRVDSRDSSCAIIIDTIPKAKKSWQYKKVTKLTFRIIFIYGATWAPSIIYYSITTMKPSTFSQAYYVSQLEMILTFTIKYITFFNAAAAPILYCYNHAEFKKEAKRFFVTLKRNLKCFSGSTRRYNVSFKR